MTRIPYARAVSMKEKIQSRLSDELTSLYMESVRTNGPTSRAATVWDSLKTEFRNMERAADFLEALQDSEATLAIRIACQKSVCVCVGCSWVR